MSDTFQKNADLLRSELKMLSNAVQRLNTGLQKMENIELKLHMTESELETADSFSARFMRVYEVLINQVLRTTLIMLKEQKPTLLDRLNKAEQLRLIKSANQVDDFRILRNIVAHEYLIENWLIIYARLIDQARLLLLDCELIQNRISEKFDIKI